MLHMEHIRYKIDLAEILVRQVVFTAYKQKSRTWRGPACYCCFFYSGIDGYTRIVTACPTIQGWSKH
jgi:hypothetical protein